MKKVLIIDDDENVARALNLRVRSAGYEAVTAGDALNGIVAAAKVQPDAVLMDINMPGGNGFSVAEHIQALMPGHTSIIFITASRKPGLLDRAIEMGASGFIEKPYCPEKLLELLHNVLDKPPLTVHAAHDNTHWGINE